MQEESTSYFMTPWLC